MVLAGRLVLGQRQRQARHGLVRRFGKDRHDLALAIGQPDRLLATTELATGDVEGERPEANLLDQRRRRCRAALQDRIDPQQQLARLERLAEIVVGAEFIP